MIDLARLRSAAIAANVAHERFVEAKKKADANREKKKVERVLEPKLAAAFTAQGAAFLKRFASLEGQFSENLTSDWVALWNLVVADTEETFIVPLETAIETAMMRGAYSQIAAFGLDIAFDLTNERAVDYLEYYAAELVTGINDTTRDYLATIITNGVRDGQSYTQIANVISTRFAEFAGKVKGGSHIRSRAELVSITEVGNAFAEGNRIIVKDLQAGGLAMQKKWLTRGDDRVSKGCLKNQAAGWIDIDEDYPSGDQRPLRFPGCRCDEQYRIAPKA